MRIPTIKPGDTRLTTEVPTQPLDPKVASTGGRMLSDFGSGIAEVAGIFEKAQAQTEHMKESNNYELNYADLEDRATKEPDPKKRQVYLDELNTLPDKYAKNISMPGNRDIFKLQMEAKNNIGRVKINSLFNDKVIEEGKGEFLKSLDIIGNKYSRSTNPLELESFIHDRDNLIKNSVDSHYISPAQGEEIKIKTDEEWVKNHMNTDILVDPKKTLDELQKGEQGFYAGVDKGTLVKGIDEAKREIIRRQQLDIESLNRQKVALRTDVLGRIASNNFDWNNSAKEISNIQKIDADLAESVQNISMTRGLINVDEKDTAFQAMIKNMFASDNPKEITDALVSTLRKENVSQDKLSILVEAAKLRASNRAPDVKTGIDLINNTKNKLFSKSEMYESFLKNTNSGMGSQKAYAQAVNEQVTKTNPQSLKYTIGQIITNPKGESAEVVGINDNGSPMLKRKISGK